MSLAAARDTVLFDFESDVWHPWTVEGGAFGDGPFEASAHLPAWRPDRAFVGWEGRRMAIVGDTRHARMPAGRLTSPTFEITRDYLRFRFGAELHPEVRVELWVGRHRMRVAYGNNSYDLRERGWDVSDLRGQTAHLVVEASANVPMLLRFDHVTLSDFSPPAIQAQVAAQESAWIRAGEFRMIMPAPTNEVIASADVSVGPAGRYHVVASIASGVYEEPNRIVHATAPRLDGPFETLAEIEARPMARTPRLVSDGGRLHLFYVAGGRPWRGWDDATQGPYRIDRCTWNGTDWESDGQVFEEGPFPPDPWFIKDGDSWRVYTTTAEPADVSGRHAIKCRESQDLLHWSEGRIVFRRHDPTPWPEHSFVRNPVVVPVPEGWLLMTGPMGNANRSRFHYRQIFLSRDPLLWPTPNAEHSPFGGLFLESAGLVVDTTGTPFVVHSGPWSGGVWVAPLEFGASPFDQKGVEH